MWLALIAPAEAAFWDREQKASWTLGVDLVAYLGKDQERSPFGVGFSAELQRTWATGPYRRVQPEPDPTGIATFAAHLQWVHPVVTSSLVASAGPMILAEVGDAGFLPLFGGELGVGGQLSTDGSVGPLFSASALAPYSELTFSVSRWQGWHAPQMALGGRVSTSCCAYLTGAGTAPGASRGTSSPTGTPP